MKMVTYFTRLELIYMFFGGTTEGSPLRLTETDGNVKLIRQFFTLAKKKK